MRLPKSRRGALAAAAIAVPLITLTACGSGTNAQTMEIKPDNAATSVGTIKVQNATIITQPRRSPDGPAVVNATLFNNSSTDETLDSVTVDGTGKSAKLSPAKGSGPLTVPAHGSVVLGGRGNASAVIADGTDAVKDGAAQPVTFVFSRTGVVKLDTFVIEARSFFSKWGPSEAPTPSETPSESSSGSPSETPSGSTSGRPGDEASDNASDSPADDEPAGGASDTPAGDDGTGAGGGDAIGTGTGQ